jgi:hypothetical protein
LLFVGLLHETMFKALVERAERSFAGAACRYGKRIESVLEVRPYPKSSALRFTSFTCYQVRYSEGAA